LPELNGYKDDYFYYDDPIYAKNYDINSIYQFYYNNYISFYFDHCTEVINLGTEDNPLYSCLRCYFSYELFQEENTNISYCIEYYQVDNYYDTENCKEKKFKIIDKKNKIHLHFLQ
jgi:protein-arginine kinase activator protein McsA